MTDKHSDQPTALGIAAVALDRELERFRKLAEFACNAKLGTRKDVERALNAVKNASESQELLNTRMREFIEALNEARSHNDRSAAELQSRREELERRCDVLNDLLRRFAKLGDVAAEISATTRAITEGAKTDEPDPEAAARLAEVEARMAKVGDDARDLAREASDAGINDLAVDIDSVRQQIASARGRANVLMRRLLRDEPPSDDGKGQLN